ncbi:allantoate permease [Verticillium alfalfae VaMs.102]|uniref:Allantoate permease n=1 Tax=Verticillium alfalfae (strain VaMs.102 / ATCC MYA-4576 / FGSC 10136) TaxID=526221 RepID=C9SXM5_VERA1|nr:allantoate permease [Verticillium alfalfae VaMs.102]EEY23415.1 allantoate permease [Verticillium alfalfae VaMs.102]
MADTKSDFAPTATRRDADENSITPAPLSSQHIDGHHADQDQEASPPSWAFGKMRTSTASSSVGSALYSIWVSCSANTRPISFFRSFPWPSTFPSTSFAGGVVIACSAAAEDFGSLMAVRFLLGIQNKTYKRHQVIEAVSDPVTWCYVLLQVTSTLIIGGLGVFSNLIISGFGFTVFETQLLNIAQGAITIIIMIFAAFTAQRTQQTAFTMHAWSFPAIIGTAVIYSIVPTASNRVGLLIAFYCTQFFLAEGNLVFSLISRNVAGQTKKSTTLTMCFVGWAAGNMTAPQIFQAWDAPRYRTGFTVHFCLYAIFNVILIVMRFLLTRRNMGKRAAVATAGEAETLQQAGEEKITHSNAFADLTDQENPDFRYVF